jgi:hypothetical protein
MPRSEQRPVSCSVLSDLARYFAVLQRLARKPEERCKVAEAGAAQASDPPALYIPYGTWRDA